MAVTRRGLGALAMSLAFTIFVSPSGRALAADAGQPAPDFKLPSTMGGDIALSDYRGRKWVLLEFYGADFAPT
jgi:AhpC/TSA family protein